MTPAQRYRKRLEVSLSSGESIQVRPLNKTDWLFLGDIPNVIGSGEADRVLRGRSEDEKRKLIDSNVEFFERLVKCALTRCVTTPGFKVVDKPASQCAEDEIAFEEMSQPDQTAITTVVMRASGLAREGAAGQAATFPQEQEVPAGTGHDGAALREPSPPTA